MPIPPFVLWSLALTIATFLFVAHQVALLRWFHWFPNNWPLYGLIGVCGGALVNTIWRHTRYSWEGLRLFLAATGLSTLLLAFAPIIAPGKFHFLIFAVPGMYLIALLVLGLARLKARTPSVPAQKPLTLLAPLSCRESVNRLYVAFVCLITLTFFAFGLTNLTRFAAVDEPLWLDGRIGKFWKNLSEHRIEKTLISDKPGITVVWAAGPALWVVDPKDYRDGRYEYQAKNPDLKIEHFYFAFRFPFLIVITLLLPLFYVLLTPLIGRSLALLAYAAIALAPVLIGISKIINPDSLLWLFAPLSFLAYLVYLEKKTWRFLIFSGILFGLALLTKYVANFLMVYFFGLLFLYPIWQRQATPERLTQSLKEFSAWIGLGLATLYIAVPVFWVRPYELLTTTLMSEAFEKVAGLFLTIVALVFFDQQVLRSRLSRLLLVGLTRWQSILMRSLVGFFLFALVLTLLNGVLGMPWFDFQDLLASPKSATQIYSFLPIFLTHFYPLTFGSSPLIVLGVLLAGTKLLLLPSSAYQMRERVALSAIIFILLYYLGSSIDHVVLINRYQIMLYPLMALLGSIGLWYGLAWFGKRLSWIAKLHLPEEARVLPVGLLFIGFLLSPLWTPFPLSYASFLLPKDYTVDVKDMGAGSYEAAQYLNQLPDAAHTAIWTDKNGVCKFYVGPCHDGFTFRKLREYNIRYAVFSTGRESRTRRMFSSTSRLLNDDGLIRFDEFYSRSDPLYELRVNGRPGQIVTVFPLAP